MAEIDRDVVADIAPKCEVDGESGVFDTHIRARAFDQMMRNFVRLAGTPENPKRTTTR
jgi:hypothetical protein